MTDIWIKEGNDHVAKIGEMEKAIVVKYCKFEDRKYPFYKISITSVLIFTEEIYYREFRYANDAMDCAETEIIKWMTQGVNELNQLKALRIKRRREKPSQKHNIDGKNN